MDVDRRALSIPIDVWEIFMVYGPGIVRTTERPPVPTYRERQHSPLRGYAPLLDSGHLGRRVGEILSASRAR